MINVTAPPLLNKHPPPYAHIQIYLYIFKLTRRKKTEYHAKLHEISCFLKAVLEDIDPAQAEVREGSVFVTDTTHL